MTLLALATTEDTHRSLSAALCEMHRRWQPTMEVSVWGRAKATRVDREGCRDRNLIGKARYPGDCDECRFFMGARFEGKAEYFWGDHADACCALDLEIVSTPAPAADKEPAHADRRAE